ncbi:hypothetical protein RYX56_06970 [Alkalihalophilus lindianensis]|uniref:Uncharacterized protein n=1 Tax=Alkalihalophilus lindianensis TaxID=1630542 RepID=A0ABU3X8Y8_9BACI|nr:hypothetical protein [Alkalihalophilus lindianensis]MDV2684107.1 hypothetical protein [Alkalihalophilus lindianensis]
MIKRKLQVASLTIFLVVLIGSSYITSWEQFNGFFEAWYFVSLFAILGILFYLLPVSILAEMLTRHMTNSIIRGFVSLFIHVGLVALFGLWDSSLGYVAVFAALAFFIIDELTRGFMEVTHFKRFILVFAVLAAASTISFMIVGFLSVH